LSKVLKKKWDRTGSQNDREKYDEAKEISKANSG
jgi:hypothetical protein